MANKELLQRNKELKQELKDRREAVRLNRENSIMEDYLYPSSILNVDKDLFVGIVIFGLIVGFIITVGILSFHPNLVKALFPYGIAMLLILAVVGKQLSE